MLPKIINIHRKRTGGLHGFVYRQKPLKFTRRFETDCDLRKYLGRKNITTMNSNISPNRLENALF